jgi:hypothetical protein
MGGWWVGQRWYNKYVKTYDGRGFSEVFLVITTRFRFYTPANNSSSRRLQRASLDDDEPAHEFEVF